MSAMCTTPPDFSREDENEAKEPAEDENLIVIHTQAVEKNSSNQLPGSIDDSVSHEEDEAKRAAEDRFGNQELLYV